MTPTRDPEVIASELARLTGRPVPIADRLAQSKRFIALTDAAGLLVFMANTKHTCDAAIFADPDATGADKKAMINRGFSWVFANTPIFVMRGHVNKDNAAMIAMAPHVNGMFLAEQTETLNVYKITLASLTKHYGIDTVIASLREGGQLAKADKLQAAYNAWSLAR